ncbi:hypothetical protein J0A67_10255 [Algoriphagus aestuariicola]|jgi:ribosomal protein L21E|uniref:Uncharacterized protein n=1 Tax=Algoriphagus aestuariicola TaxID=1852016 RepID=A0ABS3BSJ8_9BACT|nr:hypothetical protein [Algoriphagus aestuariicola]MBN7801246.1 hypothetical protein [Algoriphagus aestuariicola]
MKNEYINKYKVGEKVATKADPSVELTVRKYYAGIYYCVFVALPHKKELALFERELL